MSVGHIVAPDLSEMHLQLKHIDLSHKDELANIIQQVTHL